MHRFTLAVNNSLTRHFLVSNGIRWPLTLIRNLEEKNAYSQTRELVCFEQHKDGTISLSFPTKKVMGRLIKQC